MGLGQKERGSNNFCPLMSIEHIQGKLQEFQQGSHVWSTNTEEGAVRGDKRMGKVNPGYSAEDGKRQIGQEK